MVQWCSGAVMGEGGGRGSRMCYLPHTYKLRNWLWMLGSPKLRTKNISLRFKNLDSPKIPPRHRFVRIRLNVAGGGKLCLYFHTFPRIPP